MWLSLSIAGYIIPWYCRRCLYIWQSWDDFRDHRLLCNAFVGHLAAKDKEAAGDALEELDAYFEQLPRPAVEWSGLAEDLPPKYEPYRVAHLQSIAKAKAAEAAKIAEAAAAEATTSCDSASDSDSDDSSAQSNALLRHRPQLHSSGARED